MQRRFTTAERHEMWRRWRQGESVTDIARALTRTQGVIFKLVQRRGGIPPRPRCRAVRALTRTERELFDHAVRAGVTCRAIARSLHRPPSTISRAGRRHGGRAHDAAAEADAAAWRAAHRPKPCR